MFRNVPLLVLLGAVVGCARGSPTSSETSGIVGYWFGCEFGSSDSCQILDDDGAHFTADGEVYAIEVILPRVGGHFQTEVKEVSRWEERGSRIRWSFGTRWWSWSGQVGVQSSWRKSLNRPGFIGD